MVWMTVYKGYLYLRRVKCYCKTGLARRPKLFFQGNNWVKRINLNTFVHKIVYNAIQHSCFSPDGLISEKCLHAFTDLRHLWNELNVRLSVKSQVYTASMKSLLLYDFETWPSRADVSRLSVFEHCSFLVLAEYGGKPLSVTQRWAIRNWVLGHCIRVD